MGAAAGRRLRQKAPDCSESHKPMAVRNMFLYHKAPISNDAMQLKAVDKKVPSLSDRREAPFCVRPAGASSNG